MYDLLLRDGHLIGESGVVDLAIQDGKIAARGPELSGAAHRELDLGGRLVISGFVESHLHIDIALMNPMEQPGRPEPYLSQYGLNETLERWRKAFTHADIEARASRAVEMASRHGVVAMRVQCHVDPQVRLGHLEALLAVRERYRERMAIQIVTFPQQGLLRQPKTLDLFREAFRRGADVMGCASNLDRGVHFREHIDAAFELAVEMGIDLDVHTDLGIPGDVAVEDLEVFHLARRAIERGYQSRVTAAHVCALDSLPPEELEGVIRLIRQAEMHIISQPDLYRLGRDDRRHVRRGLTRVKELLAAGAHVAYASNNVRDALRPLGNFDLLEEGLILAYGAHMDTIEQLETILLMSTDHAARILGLNLYGHEVGCQADLVVLDAPTAQADLTTQSEKLYVIKAGRIVAASTRTSQFF